MHLTDICRLCLIKSSKTSEELFFPIDEGFENKFKEVTSLNLHKSEDDSSIFPSTVCISCVSELESHYNYRCGLIAKQSRLNTLLGIKNGSVPKDQIETNKIKSDPPDESPAVIVEEPIVEYISSQEEELMEDSEKIEQGDPDDMELMCDEEEQLEEMPQYEEVYGEESEGEHEVDQEYIQEDDSNDNFYYVDEENEADDTYVIIEGAEVEAPTTSASSAVRQKRKYIKQPKNTDKQFKCWMEKCKRAFAFRATLRKHLMIAHDYESDKSTCLICGERFEVYSEFLSHVKIHTRKSECDICKLRFVNDEKMQAHRARVHANGVEERCYPCEVRLIS